MKREIVYTKPICAVLYYVQLPLSSQWLFDIGEKGEITVTAIKAPAESKANFQLDGFEFNITVT